MALTAKRPFKLSWQQLALASLTFSVNVTMAAEIAVVADHTAIADGNSIQFQGDFIADIADGATLSKETTIAPNNQSVATKTKGEGTLNFLGDGTVPGQIGTEEFAVKQLTAAANKTITLQGDSFFTGDINFNDQAPRLVLSAPNDGDTITLNANNITNIAGKTTTGSLIIDDTQNDTTVTINSLVGDTQAIKEIVIGNGKSNNPVTVNLKNNTKLNNDIIFKADNQVLNLEADLSLENIDFFGKDSTVNITKGLTIDARTSIDGHFAGATTAGTLIFQDSATPSTVNAKIGNLNSLSKIEIANTTVTFNTNKVMKVGELAFTGNGTAKLNNGTVLTGAVTGTNQGVLNFLEGGEQKGGDIGDLTAILIDTNTKGGQTVTLEAGNITAQNIIIGGAVGHDSTLVLTGVNNIVNGNFSTFSPNTNIIDFKNTAKVTGNIGSMAAPFSQIKVAENNDITLNGNVWADNLMLQGNNNVTFEEDTLINAAVKVANPDEGGLFVEKSITFNGPVGEMGTPIATLETRNNGTTTLSENSFITQIEIKNTSTLRFTQDITITTGLLETKGGGSTLDIGDHTITVTGDAGIDANDRLQVSVGGTQSGQLIVNGTAVNDAASILAVDFQDSGFIDNQTYPIIQSNMAGGLNVIAIEEVDDSAMLSAETTLSMDGKTLNLTVSRTPLTAATLSPSPQSQPLAAAFESTGNNLPAALLPIMGELQSLDTAEEVADGLLSLTSPIDLAVGHHRFIHAQIDQMLSRRINLVQNTAYDASGMNAGENDEGWHAWAQLLGSDFDQSDRDGIYGYDGKTWGLIVGSDWEVDEQTILGLMFGVTDSDIDYRFANNTLDLTTYLGMVYGSYQFESPWVFEGQFGAAYHDYHQTRHILLPGFNAAEADYHAWEFRIKGVMGYEWVSGAWHLTPAASLSFSHLDTQDYVERNAGAANLTVSTENLNALILGTGFKLAYQEADDAAFVPAVHANIYYDFMADKQKINSFFAGTTFGYQGESFKPERLSYELGASLTIKSEVGYQAALSYDYNTASKFKAHNGFVKLSYYW